MCEALPFFLAYKCWKTKVFFIVLDDWDSKQILDHCLPPIIYGLAEKQGGLCSINLLAGGSFIFCKDIKQALAFTFTRFVKN